MGKSAAANMYDTNLGGRSIRLRGLSTTRADLFNGAIVKWDNSVQEWLPAIASGVVAAEALGVVEQQFPCDAEAHCTLR